MNRFIKHDIHRRTVECLVRFLQLALSYGMLRFSITFLYKLLGFYSYMFFIEFLGFIISHLYRMLRFYNYTSI